jgi:CheY-like chemotaxis protein
MGYTTQYPKQNNYPAQPFDFHLKMASADKTLDSLISRDYCDFARLTRMDSKLPILVADDDANDLFFLRRAFSAAKVQNPLHSVANGSELVEYLSGRGKYSQREEFPLPFIILLDLNMPVMNGFEVLSWIRNQPVLKRLPIVVFSSSNLPEDINQSYDLGANSYAVKPPTFEHLVEFARQFDGYWLKVNCEPSVSA